jgi:hypothetical protein
MKHKEQDGIRNQVSKDDVAGDGGEHPFVRDSIQRSAALRKVSADDAGPAAAAIADSDALQVAVVESSCESLGSKGKNKAPTAEGVLDEVLSFEQRRKEILRLTREAEERKKRFVIVCGVLANYVTSLHAAGKDALADGAGSQGGRRARAQEERGGMIFSHVVHRESVLNLAILFSVNLRFQLLEAEEMRKNELHRRVEDLHKRYAFCNQTLECPGCNTWHRSLEEQRGQRLSFERAELQKLKQRGKPLCVVDSMRCRLGAFSLTRGKVQKN